MRAAGYVQIVADTITMDNKPRSLKIARVTKTYPRDPLPGAIVVKLSVEVPDELLSLQAEVLLDIEEAIVAQVEQEELEVVD